MIHNSKDYENNQTLKNMFNNRFVYVPQLAMNFLSSMSMNGKEANRLK